MCLGRLWCQLSVERKCFCCVFPMGEFVLRHSWLPIGVSPLFKDCPHVPASFACQAALRKGKSKVTSRRVSIRRAHQVHQKFMQRCLSFHFKPRQTQLKVVALATNQVDLKCFLVFFPRFFILHMLRVHSREPATRYYIQVATILRCQWIVV